MASFPEEIIETILTRLPVKSLCRFKCVSKPWLSLISSQRFIKSHLVTYSPNFPRIIIHDGSRHSHFSAHSLISESVPESTQMGEQGYWVSLKGSCNGLVLVLIGGITQNDLYLFNPCTGNSKKLPPDNVDDFARGVYGLGYNQSKDDYVVITIFITETTSVHKSQVKVYSCRTNSWKIVGDFMYGVADYDIRCKFVAGKFHFGRLHVGPRQFDIISFDLDNVVYGKIGQPDYGDGVEDLSLEVLGGCICVVCSMETHVDVWVMKEYGVEESWCKTVTVRYLAYSKPLIMSSSGEILLLYEYQLVVYDPKDRYLKVLRTCDIGEVYEADVYVESLVWPTQDETIRGRDQ